MIEITAGNAERRVAELRFHFGQRRSLADEFHCVRMPQTLKVGAPALLCVPSTKEIIE